MAAALQRSTVSFRRQGSSGKIWNSSGPGEGSSSSGKVRNSSSGEEELKQRLQENNDKQPRSISGGGGTSEICPVSDPPSPRVPACGFCAIFRKSNTTTTTSSTRGTSRHGSNRGGRN